METRFEGLENEHSAPKPANGATRTAEPESTALSKLKMPALVSEEDSGEDSESYDDVDEAGSFIQPAMSPAVTRLMSPRTPAAERAAIMSGMSEDHFKNKSPQSTEPKVSDHQSTAQTALPTSPSTDTIPALPTPWRAGAQQIQIDPARSPRTSLFGVFNPPGHKRATSGGGMSGSDAFRRLSKALPSLSLPNAFIPSAFSGSSPPTPNGVGHQFVTKPAASGSDNSATRANLEEQTLVTPEVVQPGSSTAPLGLQRSTSFESMLYHPLSRASSYGDDARFAHIKEQVNSRFKAIVDSIDSPFKLPAMRNPFSADETSSPAARSSTINKTTNTSLDGVLRNLTGDLVVMGGYRGSVLRSAEPPHRQLWVPVKVGLNIRKVNLTLGLDPEAEEKSEETVIPSGMLKHIGPVDMSRKLFKRLRECENYRNGTLRVHDYGYDWRLSPHILSKRLLNFMKTLPSNQGLDPPQGALVIAHSLGGLITRHAVNRQPNLFSGVVYAGSPQRCINILGPFRNGDAVLLNEKLLTAAANFSMRSTFIFLPEDGHCFVDKETGEDYPVDFYKADDWIKYRLSPEVGQACLAPMATLTNSTNVRTTALNSFRSLSETVTTGGRSISDLAAKRAESFLRQANPMTTKDRTLAPQMGAGPPVPPSTTSPTTASASTRDILSTPVSDSVTNNDEDNDDNNKALTYLRRTLQETKQFRLELAHNPSHQSTNSYPPIAAIYGKNTPTVYAARVLGRRGIIHSDAYDDLVFGSGDGVVLAREAMPPQGYEIVSGGRVSTEKGHVTMLSDLEAVGRALEAVVKGRRKGVGLRGDVDGNGNGNGDRVATL